MDDKLPGVGDVDEQEKGTVKDSYEFILVNFMEMNKLWFVFSTCRAKARTAKRRNAESNESDLGRNWCDCSY
jgi:hypothetical protein